MTRSPQFEAHLAEWLAEVGDPPGIDPVEATIARAKKEILYDVKAGLVPRTVRSFGELHDFVDANGYGNAFSWPDLPSETNDEAYVIAHCNFWNDVQDKLHAWLVDGGIRAAD